MSEFYDEMLETVVELLDEFGSDWKYIEKNISTDKYGNMTVNNDVSTIVRTVKFDVDFNVIKDSIIPSNSKEFLIDPTNLINNNITPAIGDRLENLATNDLWIVNFINKLEPGDSNVMYTMYANK